jgi:hypothetical protein
VYAGDGWRLLEGLRDSNPVDHGWAFAVDLGAPGQPAEEPAQQKARSKDLKDSKDTKDFKDK